jgi:hypothetical protein
MSTESSNTLVHPLRTKHDDVSSPSLVHATRVAPNDPDEDEANGSAETERGLSLELGDVIEITAPTNADLHERIYYIMYVDESKVRLIDLSTYVIQTLHIDENNHLTDESITQLSILSRSEEKGYARQNKLLPATWIDIHFGGEIPTILTGEITNLEEDMIEVTTFPELKVIYLNFDYKGLPEDIPIEMIAIREKPISLKKGESLVQMNNADLDDLNLEEATIQTTETGEMIYQIPEGTPVEDNVREQLHTMYLEADDILFEDIGQLIQLVEVAEHEKRFSVEAQLADLTDQWINAIPLQDRTDTEIEKIGRLLEKFKQLRHHFSVFDSNGNVSGYRTVGGLHKPIVEKLARFNRRIKWLIPVVKFQKKIYSSSCESESCNLANPLMLKRSYPDVEFENTAMIADEIDNLKRIESNTVGDTNRYDQAQREEINVMTPFYPHTDAIHNESERILIQVNEVGDVFESIVSNLGDLYSSVMSKPSPDEQYILHKRRAVIQRYGLGVSRMTSDQGPSGRKVFIRRKVAANDAMTVQSMLMLPSSVIRYTRVDSPATNILTRTSLSQHGLYMYRLLKEKTNVVRRSIDTLSNELDYEGVTTGTPEKFLTKTVKEYTLDPSIDIGEDTFQKMMYSIIPKTAILIRQLESNLTDELSLLQMLRELEPFQVYDDDLTWKQYEYLSDYIKEAVKKRKLNIQAKSKEYTVMKTAEYGIHPPTNRVMQMMSENVVIDQWMMETYRLFNTSKNCSTTPMTTVPTDVDMLKEQTGIFNQSSESASLHVSSTPSEHLAKIMERDGGQLYAKMIQFLLLSLITPDKIMDMIQPANIDDDQTQNAMKASQCARRVIAKKYTSFDHLKKDNAKEIDDASVAWDDTYDKTPYDLLSRYTEERAKVSPEDFLEFFTQILIEKHDVPANKSTDLAVDIIRGKRVVRDGEYSVLEIRPTLPNASKETDLTEREVNEIETEANIRSKRFYYKRVNGNWVRDEEISEEAFIDDNDLLCNLEASCRSVKNKCMSEEDNKQRMLNITRQKMMDEFDKRWVLSLEDTQKQLETELAKMKHTICRRQNLREIQQQRPNMLAYQLGKYADGRNTTAMESPHMQLRDLILSQDDFVSKQKNIIRFVETYTREPMLDKSTESPHWAYCMDTNAKLFPYSLYELAKAFVYDDRYEEVLDRLCAQVGEQEGNAIVDKHSGYVLRTLDFAVEEEYDEAGFKIVTHKVMEEQATLVLADILSKKSVEVDVKEDETTQILTNIYVALSQHMGIRKDAVDDEVRDFVVRVSSQLVNDTSVVMTESEYKKKSDKNLQQKGKPLPFTYRDFRHQTMLMIVGASLLVGVQGLIPGFRTRKTYPGCVRSFGGYPFEGGEESTSGIEYVACIMISMRAPVAPWDSLKKLNVAKLVDGMKRVLDKYILVREDVIAKRMRKQEYLLSNPVLAVPAEIDVSKWRHFLPPLVDYSLEKSLHGLPVEFEKELVRTMNKGHRDQDNMIGVLYHKLILHGYAVFDTIRNLVHEKDLLMKTASNVPFRENACCNDGTRKKNALAYFAENNDQIAVYISRSMKMEETLQNVRELSRAAMLYHPTVTGIRYVSELPQRTSLFDTEKHVYGAFIHYCNFDNDLSIPDDLVSVCNAKPLAGYDRNGTIEEKMYFLKSNGKRYMREEAIRLMSIVNRRKKGSIPETVEVSPINQFKSAIEHLELSGSVVVEKPLRDHIWKVLDDYVPNRMVHEERPSVRALYRHLRESNDTMFTEIMHAINERGNLSDKEYEEVRTFLWEIDVWSQPSKGSEPSTEVVYKIVQFIKNSVNAMASLYPQMITKRSRKNIPIHWDVAKAHKELLMEKTNDVHALLKPFRANPLLTKVFTKLDSRISDLVLLMNHLPVFSPIVKHEHSFYSLMDTKTTLAFAKYMWYSVFHEYLWLSMDPELVGYEKVERRMDRLERREKMEDPSQLLSALMGEHIGRELAEHRLDDDADMELEEVMVEFHEADSTPLRDEVVRLLVTFIRIEKREKITVNKSYEDIQKRRRRMRDEEKRGFTDLLGNMSKEERALEGTFRKYKLGRWNQGVQKGMFQYDKNTFEKDIKNEILNNALATEDDIVLMMDVIPEENGVDAEEMDAIQESEELDTDELANNDFEYYDEYNNPYEVEE